MNDKLVLDASVIAAIFLPESITASAIDVAAEHDCITVDIAYAEVANAAWKRAVHAGNDPAMVKTFLDNASAFIHETCEVMPARDLITPAWDLACRHRITIYDALFVAASIEKDVPLATADLKLAKMVGDSCKVLRVE